MVIIQIVFIIFLSISYTYGDYSCKDGIQMCYVSDSVGEEKATCCYPGANACITEISSKTSFIQKMIGPFLKRAKLYTNFVYFLHNFQVA